MVTSSFFILLVSCLRCFHPLRIQVNPERMIREASARTVTIIMNEFAIEEANLKELDRLMRFEKYDFVQHMLLPMSSERQVELIPFLSRKPYHQTLFHPAILLFNEKLLQVVLSLGDIEYSGNFLDHLPIHSQTLYPIDPALYLELLKYAFSQRFAHMTSPQLIEDFLFRAYPQELKEELFSWLLTNHFLHPDVGQLFMRLPELDIMHSIQQIIEAFHNFDASFIALWFHSAFSSQRFTPSWDLRPAIKILQRSYPHIWNLINPLIVLGHNSPLMAEYLDASLEWLKMTSNALVGPVWATLLSVLYFQLIDSTPKSVQHFNHFIEHFLERLEMIAERIPAYIIRDILSQLFRWSLTTVSHIRNLNISSLAKPLVVCPLEERLNIWFREGPGVMFDYPEGNVPAYELFRTGYIPINYQLGPPLVFHMQLIVQACVTFLHERRAHLIKPSLPELVAFIRDLKTTFSILLWTGQKLDWSQIFPLHDCLSTWQQLCEHLVSWALHLSRHGQEYFRAIVYMNMGTSSMSHLSLFSLVELRSMIDASFSMIARL